MINLDSLRKGDKVRALKMIVESDVEPDSSAEPCTPGWVHAEKGDPGEVVFVEPRTGQVSVAFGPREFDNNLDDDGPGYVTTVTIVFEDEIEKI